MRDSNDRTTRTMSNYFLPRMIICEKGCGSSGHASESQQSSTIDDEDNENFDDDNCRVDGGKNESREGDNNYDEDGENEGGENEKQECIYSPNSEKINCMLQTVEETLDEMHLASNGHNNNHHDNNHDSNKSEAADTAPTATVALSASSTAEDLGAVAAFSSSPPTAAASVRRDMIEETGELSPLYVGRIIGKGGEMIRDLQARSGCHIDVNQNVGAEEPRIITYRGRSQEDIEFAKKLVDILCTTSTTSASLETGVDHHAELPLGKATLKRIQVPKSVIGRIIGRGGEMIRDIQSKSHARVQVDHTGEAAQQLADTATGNGSGIDVTHQHHRQVTITGTRDAVTNAEQMILILASHPGLDGHLLVRDRATRGTLGGSVSVDGSPSALWRQGSGSAGGHSRHSSGMSNPYQQKMPPPSGPYWDGGFLGEQENAPAAVAGAGYGHQHYQQQQREAWDHHLPIIETDSIPCSKSDVGHIIGRKGATIQDLQRRTSCNIQIDQQDFQISITGSRNGIELAKSMLIEIMEHGPHHPYAGGQRLQFGDEQQQQQQDTVYPPILPHGFLPDQQQHQRQPQPHFQTTHTGYPNEQQQYGMSLHQQQPFYADQMMYQQQHPQEYQHQPYPMQQQHQQAQQQQQQRHPYPAQATQLPWTMATTANGQVYWYNQETLETRWEKPGEA